MAGVKGRFEGCIPERVFERVRVECEVRGVKDCWVLTFGGSNQYVQVQWYADGERRYAAAHRVAWIAANGPIPDGYGVERTCYTPKCVRVDHLALISEEVAKDRAQWHMKRRRRAGRR